MAINIPKTLGGQSKLVTALGRDGRLVSSFREVYVAVREKSLSGGLHLGSAADHFLRDSVGAIGWPVDTLWWLWPRTDRYGRAIGLDLPQPLQRF